MIESLIVETSVIVDKGCDLRGVVHGTDLAEFMFDEGSRHLDISFDADCLRRFYSLAGRALADMDVRHARDEAGEPYTDDVTRLDSTDQG